MDLEIQYHGGLRWALGNPVSEVYAEGKCPMLSLPGTESRKPLNYTCVTVVLDNQGGFIQQAGKEIRVEQHIYRSGDSELQDRWQKGTS